MPEQATPTALPLDSRAFRTTLGHFATGVTVVTMRYLEQDYGITVNAFMSVSLEPPLVVVSIDHKAKAYQSLCAVSHYGVSMLSHGQQPLSNYFAGFGAPEQAAPAMLEVQGVPLLESALAHLVCRVVDRHEAGDHTLFIGQVEYLAYRDSAPLLYYRGGYAALAES